MELKNQLGKTCKLILLLYIPQFSDLGSTQRQAKYRDTVLLGYFVFLLGRGSLETRDKRRLLFYLVLEKAKGQSFDWPFFSIVVLVTTGPLGDWY